MHIIPEVEKNEVYILDCDQQSPGKVLQRLINDGRSYSRESTTNQSLVTLFPGLKKSMY